MERKTLSTKQEKLLAHLLSERTIDSACQKANVAVTTYWRWMKDPLFLSHYRELRRGLMENAIAKIQASVFTAIETLDRNLNCENASVEIRCASIILEQSIKGIELLDLAHRIEGLEMVVTKNQEFYEQTRRKS